MADYKEKPNTIPWPPIITIGAIIFGWWLQRYMPLDWTSGLSSAISPLGVLMVILALSMDVWAFVTFKQMKTTIMPNKAATHLATNGPFRWSRNPIYVGNIVLILGFAVIFGNVWMIITAVLAFFAIGELAIKREEEHLEAQFGGEWKEYTSRVRRWL